MKKLKDMKLPKEVLDDILKQEDSRVEGLFLTDEEFKLLEDPSFDLEAYREKKKQGGDEKLLEAYRNIMDVLKEYLDLKKEYYNILTLWIIGTYFHNQFPSYPFLFLNAMKGSGKTRTLSLVTHLSKDGEILNSLTEAVLFRTTGTLGIDEFEGVQRKGNENLKELLNSAYKKGIKVKRMKMKKTEQGNEQVVEEFSVYRPIVMCNIWGMESVLGDRCIFVVLEKSNDPKIVNLLEIFRDEEIVKKTKELLNSVVSVNVVSYQNLWKMWNMYVKNTYHNYTNNTNNIYYTNYINCTELFKRLNLMELSGRELELSLPLCIVANEISSVVLKETTLTLKSIFEQKRAEEMVEDVDISLIDFISQKEPNKNFISVNKLTQEFREFLQMGEEWMNSRWLGRALKRLDLVIEKRRKSYGVEVILNIEKAQEKIKMFK